MKTLKDIIKIDNLNKLIISENLTQAAIEWVKELDKQIVFSEHKDFYDFENENFEQVIGFIKHFFNLTEDDLK